MELAAADKIVPPVALSRIHLQKTPCHTNHAPQLFSQAAEGRSGSSCSKPEAMRYKQDVEERSVERLL